MAKHICLEILHNWQSTELTQYLHCTLLNNLPSDLGLFCVRSTLRSDISCNKQWLAGDKCERHLCSIWHSNGWYWKYENFKSSVSSVVWPSTPNRIYQVIQIIIIGNDEKYKCCDFFAKHNCLTQVDFQVNIEFTFHLANFTWDSKYLNI